MRQKINKTAPVFNKIPKLIFFLSAFQVLIELTLYLVDSQSRILAITLFGFNPALINSNSSYLGQNFLMFVTHTFIHLNFSHMLMNVIIFMSLGSKIAKTYNSFVAVGIFFFSAILGALVYFFLSPSEILMIGASGGVFGYFGFWKTMEFLYNRKFNLSVKSTIIFVLILILINIIFDFVFEGRLAWQSHLGGFIGGFLCAFLLKPRLIA